MEFRSDAQVNVHIEGVVMRLERTGSRAAGNGMEHRRFNFQEMTVVEVFADAFDDLRPFDEGIFDFRVDDEVEVTLTITRFLVRQAMEFFRQRAEGFGQEGPFFDADRRFPGMSNEDRPFDADDITDIEELE